MRICGGCHALSRLNRVSIFWCFFFVSTALSNIIAFDQIVPTTARMQSPAKHQDGMPLETEHIDVSSPAYDAADDPGEVFEAVLAQLQRHSIAQVAEAVHRQHFPGDGPGEPEILEAIYGSFNVLFSV